MNELLFYLDTECNAVPVSLDLDDAESAIRTALAESVSRDDVLEEAAKACDELARDSDVVERENGWDCANAIRSLKGRSHE